MTADEVSVDAIGVELAIGAVCAGIDAHTEPGDVTVVVWDHGLGGVVDVWWVEPILGRVDDVRRVMAACRRALARYIGDEWDPVVKDALGVWMCDADSPPYVPVHPADRWLTVIQPPATRGEVPAVLAREATINAIDDSQLAVWHAAAMLHQLSRPAELSPATWPANLQTASGLTAAERETVIALAPNFDGFGAELVEVVRQISHRPHSAQSPAQQVIRPSGGERDDRTSATAPPDGEHG